MWYCAHVIMYHQYIDGNQIDYVGHENMVLIEAGSSREAHEKAEMLGRSQQDRGDTRPSTVDGRLTRYTYGGVRMVVECLREVSRTGPLASGDEVSYSTFIIESAEEFANYVGGRTAVVTLEGVNQADSG
jgi:hypothetical protein